MRFPLQMRYGPNDVEPLDSPDMPTAWMRWDQNNIYLAYRVDKPADQIEPSVDKVYEGDGLELFLDLLNERKGDMTSSTFSHQFTFTPWGVKMREEGVTAWEVGRNFRGLQVHNTYSVPGAVSAADIKPDHYTVEIRLPVQALARQRLVPGMYLAMDMSINRGFDYAKQTQWAASKVIRSWDKPATWGDVVLLGSDAESRFTDYLEPHKDAPTLLPGRPLGLEVSDRDMNVTPSIDRVTAVVSVRGQAQKLLVVLEETGPQTGVFRGSVDTQTYIAESKPGTLNIRGGDVINLIYIDPRAAYGEADRRVEDRCTVGYPVVTMVRRQ
jgi:hypothetical protein